MSDIQLNIKDTTRYVEHAVNQKEEVLKKNIIKSNPKNYTNINNQDINTKINWDNQIDCKSPN